MPKKRRRKRRRVRHTGLLVLLIVMIGIALGGIVWLVSDMISSVPRQNVRRTSAPVPTQAPTEPPTQAPTEPPKLVDYPVTDADTKLLPAPITSGYAVLLDVDENRVIGEKFADVRMYPASMTKLMTLIVAIEHTENFDDTFTFEEEMINPLVEQNASRAGFEPGETVTVTDLLYGAALPSGADATYALAVHTAGSEAAFVDLMNEKVGELGLTDTHFMNASGLHDPDHYSTALDMALILEYCLRNDLCREVISTYTYTTSVTEQHPEGIELYDTMFGKMYGNEVEGIQILGGKTGYTDEAGHCLASYAQTPDGHTYIAVTAMGQTKWKPVFEAFKLYGMITGTYPMEDPSEESEDLTEIPAA